MTIRTLIEDGEGTKKAAKVTSQGELVVGKYGYSLAYSVTADVINTAYNFIGPQTNQQFVITDILLYANKNVGAADATVDLYEASSPTSTTIIKTILQIEMPTRSVRDNTGLNLLVSEGVWLNIKTNDDDIFATIMGYYIPTSER